MSATGFTVDLRDIYFVLFEQLKVQDEFSQIERYADFDVETYQAMIEESYRIAQETLWPINLSGDKTGCTFHGEGKVTTPEGYPEAWNLLAESGLVAYAGDMNYGATGLPEPVAMAVGEILTGANSALSTYAGLTRGVANVLMVHGTDWMKENCIEKLNIGQWAGTMCLTEAGAGSAVGDNRCKATPTDEEGVYLLEGEKIFISGGDHDLTENILHLVLARLPDAPNGSKGLSIFLVPKIHFDSDERNGAFVVGIEHKMGLQGSATCTLALGATQPCKGYMLGKPGDGMPIMFHMMNEARVAVGIQGLASAAAAYENALAYAKERVQGTSLKEMRDPDAKRVTIVNHPDVRRMLMDMRVAVDTMRSMLYTTAQRLCLAENDPDQHDKLMGLVELMTPICKAHCTDLGFDVTVTALQTFGGYGYIQEYPVEQHVRDNKIASIYEGTNGIQAMDLLGRKMRMKSGMIFMEWMQEANAEIGQAKELGTFDSEIETLEKAVGQLGATAMHLGRVGAEGDVEGAMLYATPFLELFGTVVLAIHALEQARIAQQRLNAGDLSDADTTFYKGKVLNLKWYVASYLPKATAIAKSIRGGDKSALDEVLFQ